MRGSGSVCRGKEGGLEGWGLRWLRGERLGYMETAMKGGRNWFRDGMFLIVMLMDGDSVIVSRMRTCGGGRGVLCFCTKEHKV